MKYLGLMLDESHTWSSHISIRMLKAKLSRANGILAKLRYQTSSKLLTTIYNALFESHMSMRHCYQIWGQTRNQHVDVVKLQKKAVRIINFSDKYTSTKPLFNELRILSFDEIVNLQNCLLVLNVLNNEAPEALQELFKNITNQHYYNTRVTYPTIINSVYLKSEPTLQSIKYKSPKAWNEMQTKLSDKLNIGYWSKKGPQNPLENIT